MVFRLKSDDDNLSHIDEGMIMVIDDKIITERMEVLENKMTREFDEKLKIVMYDTVGGLLERDLYDHNSVSLPERYLFYPFPTLASFHSQFHSVSLSPVVVSLTFLPNGVIL
jgi:hypothetical protein